MQLYIFEREARFVLDEAAGRRLVGASRVMRRQLDRLTELAARPGITIEVVPFSAGAYPAQNGAFVIQEFPDSACVWSNQFHRFDP